MCVLQDDFWGFGCPNDAQTPCWLRLWLKGFCNTSAANPADVQERALYFLRQSLCYLILLFYCFLKHTLLLWSLPFVLIRQLQRQSWITPIGTSLLHASRHIHNNQTWHWLLTSLLIKIITTNNTSKDNKKILHLHISRNSYLKSANLLFASEGIIIKWNSCTIILFPRIIRIPAHAKKLLI